MLAYLHVWVSMVMLMKQDMFLKPGRLSSEAYIKTCYDRTYLPVHGRELFGHQFHAEFEITNLLYY